jgi:hypothetical protein
MADSGLIVYTSASATFGVFERGFEFTLPGKLGWVRTMTFLLLYRVSKMGTGTDFFFVGLVFAAARARGNEGMKTFWV